MATDLERFCSRLDSRQLVSALGRLPVEQSLAVPCLDEHQRQTLVSLVDSLTYRSAKPIIGGTNPPVYQDFDLCYDIPPAHQLWELARYLETQIATTIKKAGLQGHDALQFNDLIVQNYPPGCRGITPHRDHVRYRIVVAIFLLTGDGNFCTCDDRKGTKAKTIPAVPGDLLLMTAPGLAEEKPGPLHFVDGVTRRRRTIGLRYDAHAMTNEVFQKT
jgi:hypothetical protein